MKKIVIIAWRDKWNPESGGAEIYITKLAEHLASTGFKVCFLTPSYKGSHSSETVNGVEYYRIGSKFISYLAIPLYFIRFLRDDTDLLIENYNAWPYLAPLLHRKSLIGFMHLQDREWYDFFPKGIKTVGGATFKYSSRLLLKVFYRKKNMFTISPSTVESIEMLNLSPTLLYEIYPGIEDSLVELSEDRSIEKHKLEKVHFYYVGRLTEHKRIHLCIKLIHSLVQNGIFNIHLDIAGKGESESSLKSMVKDLSLDEYVTFHGYVTDEEKISQFVNSHIHLQLSEFEGWGITVIEAASQGTPTLSFNVKGLRDSVSSSGYLVDDRDSLVETAMRIVEEVNDPQSEYWRKVKAAPSWAMKYTWSSQVGKFRHLVWKLSK